MALSLLPHKLAYRALISSGMAIKITMTLITKRPSAKCAPEKVSENVSLRNPALRLRRLVLRWAKEEDEEEEFQYVH